MFAFYITNQLPDSQIRDLIAALRANTEATERDIMAKNKVVAELEALETEMGELKTVGESVNALVDRLVTILDSDDNAETIVKNLRAGLKSHKEGLVGSVTKGTAAADEEEAETPSEGGGEPSPQ